MDPEKKFRGGVKYEGYLSLAVRGGGVPSHIFVISNVI